MDVNAGQLVPIDLASHGPVIPVIVIDRAELAVPMARALLEGGVRVLEITLRTSAALFSSRPNDESRLASASIMTRSKRRNRARHFTASVGRNDGSSRMVSRRASSAGRRSTPSPAASRR